MEIKDQLNKLTLVSLLRFEGQFDARSERQEKTREMREKAKHKIAGRVSSRCAERVRI